MNIIMKAYIFMTNYFKYTLPFLLPKRLYSLILVGNFVYWVMELYPFTLVVEFQKCSSTLKGLYKVICGFFQRNVQISFNGTYIYIYIYIIYFGCMHLKRNFYLWCVDQTHPCNFFLIPCNHFPMCEGYLKAKAKSHLVNLPNPTP
jgi:hypothetical protein